MFACPVADSQKRTARDPTSYCRLLAGREFVPFRPALRDETGQNPFIGGLQTKPALFFRRAPSRARTR